jgi:hypothetical protein
VAFAEKRRYIPESKKQSLQIGYGSLPFVRVLLWYIQGFDKAASL